MYIKFAGCLLLISGTTLAGFRKAEELKERVEKLETLKRMMVMMQGEFRFHHATLSEVLENVSEKMPQPFGNIFGKIAKQLEERKQEGFQKIWEDGILALLQCGGIQKTEQRIFELLGNGLGYLDLETQIDTLQLAVLQIEEKIEEAKEQRERKGKLYRTMGITLGALFVLLVV